MLLKLSTFFLHQFWKCTPSWKYTLTSLEAYSKPLSVRPCFTAEAKVHALDCITSRFREMWISDCSCIHLQCFSESMAHCCHAQKAILTPLLHRRHTSRELHGFTTIGLLNLAIYVAYHFHCFSSRCPIEPAAFSSSSNQALVLSWWSPLGQVVVGEEWGLWWGGSRKHLHNQSFQTIVT